MLEFSSSSHSMKRFHGRFMGFLFSAFLVGLLSGCVHSTYYSGPVSKGSFQAHNSRGPVYVEINEYGQIAALGRTYSNAKSLARHLRAAKATATDGRAVVLRCANDNAFENAALLRQDLVRYGVPNVSIQGPRTATSTKGPERY